MNFSGADKKILPNGPFTLAVSLLPSKEVVLVKTGSLLGLSIGGGTDHSSIFEEPGIFISNIVPDGAASRTSLRIGDRILAVTAAIGR